MLIPSCAPLMTFAMTLLDVDQHFLKPCAWFPFFFKGKKLNVEIELISSLSKTKYVDTSSMILENVFQYFRTEFW